MLIVYLLGLEAAIRAYATWVSPRMMVLDDRLGWRHTGPARKTFTNEHGDRFVVVQDRYGLRGAEHPLQRPSGKYRVLILGDSFTEGVHVGEDDVFSARLESMNRQIEALNAGVGGYGTVQEYLYLISEGRKFKPDLALVMFFDNDLTDNCLSYYAGFGSRPYARLMDGEVEIVERLDASDFLRFTIPVPFRSQLSRHSYLYYVLNTYGYQRLFQQRMRSLQQADLKRTMNCEQYRILFWLLKRMNEIMRADNGEFAVVLIPSSEEASSGTSAAQEPIMKFCGETGLKCLSLLDRFARDQRSGSRLYFDRDIHWTGAGHAVAAEEIGDFVSRIMTFSRKSRDSIVTSDLGDATRQLPMRGPCRSGRRSPSAAPSVSCRAKPRHRSAGSPRTSPPE